MSFIRRFFVELVLAVPFVGLFLAVVEFTWGDRVLFAQTVAVAVAVLPLVYLLLVLMARQGRERRKKPAGNRSRFGSKKWPAAWDDEFGA